MKKSSKNSSKNKNNSTTQSKTSLGKGRPIPLKNYNSSELDTIASELIDKTNEFDSLPDCLAGKQI